MATRNPEESKSNNAFKEEEVEKATLFGYVKDKFDEKFVNNIPSASILELPPKFILPVGLIAYAASFLCFAYFAFTAYQIERKQQFISLSKNDGECESVSISVNGDFVASSNGHWEGSDGFQEQFGKYTLELTEYQNTDQGYHAEMTDNIFPALQQLSQAALNYDGMDNLLLWMTWKASLGNPNGTHLKDQLVLNGDPRIIFRKSHLIGSYANKFSECDASNRARFDPSAAVVSLEYDRDGFLNSPSCNTTATLEYMGYDETSDFSRFYTSLDVQTLIVAAGVNKGIIPESDLVVINGTTSLVPVPGTQAFVELSDRYHSKYPGMQPVTCVLFPSVPRRFCLLKVGDTVAFPFFNHDGSDHDIPVPCDCSKVEDRLESSACQQHDFMYGLIFYNQPSLEESVQTGQNPQFSSEFAIISLVLKWGVQRIDKLAYNASFASVRPGAFTDVEWRKNAYEFCELDGIGGCSLLVFHSHEKDQFFITPNFYQVRNIACFDSFGLSESEWTALSSSPPTQLTAAYYACTASVFDAMFNSVGISIGNTQFFLPLFMLIVMPLVYFYLASTGSRPPKREYEKNEYEASLHAFAIAMLRFRDGKTKNMKKNGIVDTLVKELKVAAVVQSGYPDSDDDSDEEDFDEDSDDEFSDDEDEKRKKFGSHNVFKRKSSRIGARSSTESTTSSRGSITMIGRLGALINRRKSSKQEIDIELGKAGGRVSVRNSKRAQKKLSTQMQTLAITIVNVPVDGSSKKKRMSIAAGAGRVIKNREKVKMAVDETHDAMEKAYRVRNVDGFLDVYRVAAKKASILAQIDIGHLGEFEKLLDVMQMHTSLLLECKVEDLIGPVLDSYGYQFYEQRESIRQMKSRCLSDDSSSENGKSSRSVNFSPFHSDN